MTPQIHLSIHSETEDSAHSHYSADFTIPVINGRRPTLEQMSVPSLGEIPSERDTSTKHTPVSYTHLTLPTKRIV